MKKLFSTGLPWILLSVVVVALDRYSKYWVTTHIIPFEPLEVLPFFNLTLAFNKGAAFSFLHTASGWQNIFLGGLAVIVSIVIIYWLAKSTKKDRLLNMALALILGGALGNMFDRVLYGYVIDFFDFHLGDWHFAIFNVADSAICIGAVIVLWHWLWQKSA